MIFIFIIYFIFILWLFDFFQLDDNSLYKYSHKNFTIIINDVDNISDLLCTFDSIKSQDYDLKKINLILFTSLSEDIQTIVNPFKDIFYKITIFKIYGSDYNEHYSDIDKDMIIGDQILKVKNGIRLSNNLLKSALIYLDELSISILHLPTFHNYKSRKNLFFQLFNTFKNSIRGSFINKNFNDRLNLRDDCIIIKRDIFFEIIKSHHIYSSRNVNKKYIVDFNLCVYKKGKTTVEIPLSLRWFYLLYSIINFLFIIVITIFLVDPSVYLLVIIFIKIIPELNHIYYYYNRLKIKFPKIDFIIYSITIPFYILITLIQNRKFLYYGSKKT